MSLSTSTDDPERSGEDAEVPPPGRSRARRVAAVVLTVVAGLLVLFALVAPDNLAELTPAAFVRIPVEALVVTALALVLPPRWRRVLAGVVGAVLGVLTVLKLVDMGFNEVLSRPFDPILDWSFVSAGLDFLRGEVGGAGAVAAAIGVVLLILAVVVFTVFAALRLTRLAAGRRTGSTRVLALLGVVWIVAAVFGVQLAPGQPIASRSAAALAFADLRQVGTDLHDKQEFAAQLASDPFREVPGDQLLQGLRGKDVLLTFVESYGRFAIEGSDIAPAIDAQLDAGTQQLAAAGFSARSGFLDSATFGGGSWLAHSTVQSGTWVDNQQRYNTLLGSDRLSLTRAFGKAGWKTVQDVPAHTEPWPEGKYYGFQQYYDFRNVGYQGPGYAYATMPDQYTLSFLQRTELAAQNRKPVMAEVDFVSSHAPWSPRPTLVDWNKVGDGSIFDPQPAQGEDPEQVWKDPNQIRHAYGKAIQYTLDTLVSYLKTYGTANTVLVFLGDHQPPVVTPAGVSHQVPITIVAKDPSVLNRISDWHWTPGLKPAQSAPVWKMDTFRDHFLTAFAK
ncbi:sulfatase-like hydrolase/transferase [Amycolatopsis sp. NPDC051903]|uniref:sulfatase-like hydrolase/transferase n=1 Tax=Amycolatopsis sp. NPDC051903 TaxID=3363936 RepID=UPI00379DDF67